MAQSSSTADLKRIESRLIQAMATKDPNRIKPPPSLDPDTVLAMIGVKSLPVDRPRGFLKLFPQDFLVEEILKNGQLVSLVDEKKFDDTSAGEVLWADLVKAGIAGPHAMADLQMFLGASDEAIGWAGFKDAIALTSQRLSLRGISVEQARGVRHDRLFLRPCHYGTGKTWMGELKGNRFTIMVRTAKEDSMEKAESFLEKLKERGFANFFGPQRFGPRIISHKLGQLLLQNDVDGALRLYLCASGPYDTPLVQEVRRALAETYGDWDAMWEIAQHFPYTLFYETKILEALRREPKKTRQAIMVWKDEVRMWIYAYSSWLVNRFISSCLQSGQPYPSQIPLPISGKEPLPEYRNMMEEDGTLSFADALRFYPHIKIVRSAIPARIMPSEMKWKRLEQGIVVRFSLEKGAYATSLLGEVFRLYESSSIPDWVPLDEVDVLDVLGEGSLQTLKEKLPLGFIRRDQATELKDELE
jgi:TruD family tRNA pseudouridine synthase